MKRSLIVLAMTLSTAVTPAFSLGIDVGSITPVLTFPQPAPEPVTQDNTGIEK
jgi:hypothetical protein